MTPPGPCNVGLEHQRLSATALPGSMRRVRMMMEKTVMRMLTMMRRIAMRMVVVMMNMVMVTIGMMRMVMTMTPRMI